MPPVDPTAITSTGESWAIPPILIVLGIWLGIALGAFTFSRFLHRP